MTNIYKAGSKLAAVYQVYLDRGIEAAFKHGIEIGLAISTLKIQCKRKNWGGDLPIAAAASKAAYVPPASNKPRYCFQKGGRQMVIIHQGEQQSVIRWVDSGDEQCVVNSWLIPIKVNSQEQSK